MPMRMASCEGPQVEGQVVLVLQGGGALGAYQLGVYQALHEAGVEPDWVIGTSIGAVNGAIIAGNAFEERLPRLREFWDKVRLAPSVAPMAGPWASHWYANLATTVGGIPGFFMPRVVLFFIWLLGVCLSRNVTSYRSVCNSVSDVGLSSSSSSN